MAVGSLLPEVEMVCDHSMHGSAEAGENSDVAALTADLCAQGWITANRFSKDCWGCGASAYEHDDTESK